LQRLLLPRAWPLDLPLYCLLHHWLFVPGGVLADRNAAHQ
jgi:hypothetical protein